ncbi:hypothetical protein LCGC14_1903070 [marine sediment metagenome]|uniref:Uncharacterized protein n=1 Tax=marine sediment metagenome TaxID=412755 RepID=A0A0F9FW04_9ZZZZ
MPKGYSKHNQGGWQHSEKAKQLMSQKKIGHVNGENNPNWRGDNISYAALHNWVRKHYVRPSVCDECGLSPGVNKIGRTKLHWANKTKKYLRDRKDWLCLCVSCHKIMDLKSRRIDAQKE